MDAFTIPLFPLSNIVFPGGRLPLRIFEPRYTAMVSRCFREDSGFGVCLLKSGREAGGSGEPFDAGVCVRIVDFDQLKDGFLGIVVEGGRRFRVADRWRQLDGLWVGEAEWLPVEPACAVPAELNPMAEWLARIYRRLQEEGGESLPLHDAGWVGGRLAELLPLQLSTKQALLELDDPVARLYRLASLVESLRTR